tara:strand:- start:390 stop:548 length:159 start_codon:yes stop_codon:yes gene_type:complete
MNEWETGITNPLILHLESEKQEKIKGEKVKKKVEINNETDDHFMKFSWSWTL